jgi:hypothetical protein
MDDWMIGLLDSWVVGYQRHKTKINLDLFGGSLSAHF